MKTPRDINDWFSLTYASYLVLPRVLLQSMPPKWQKVFVAHLDQLEDAYPDYQSPRYAVYVRGDKGRLAIEDKQYRDYRHGYIEPRAPRKKP